jgi:hypothetical protein
MLLTKHFVFVHFLKSGGTFVKRLFLENAPPSWGCVDVEGHPALKEIPNSYANLPRFGFVRNPWDWYVSLYHYFTHVARDPLFEAISQGRAFGFTDTILRALDAEPFRSAGATPLQYFFNEIYTPGQPCDFLRFEDLRNELDSELARLGLDLPETLRSAICAAPELNRSPRNDYRDYYTEPLMKKIRALDAEYIERFGYEF